MARYPGVYDGANPPDEILTPIDGSSLGGAAVGIIVVDAHYAMVPGNVANAASYPFPVIFKVLEGVPFERIAANDPEVMGPLTDGANELILRGARMIFGACGSFAYYQKRLAAAVEVPVYLTVMLQVPWILTGLKPDQKVAIIAAKKEVVTDFVFDQIDLPDRSRVVLDDAWECPEFQAMLSPEGYNPRVLGEQLADKARSIVDAHPECGAILLQCSDMPPFAHLIQRATGLPVFDGLSLIQWGWSAAVRRPCKGEV